MDDVAFVDASPIIFLGVAGRIDLLHMAAARIVVPAAVVEAPGVWPERAGCKS